MAEHTVATLIEAVCHQFEARELSYGHGTDNAWDEAVALVLNVTGAADDQSALSQLIPEDQVARCLELAQQRITTRQPLAYLLGRCRYMGYDFAIQPGVVVPRSPIGYLLTEGVSAWLPKRVTHVLDLCSGSGCLGIVAAHEFPEATVTLVELSDVALQVAEENIRQHGLSDRVAVVQADVTQDLEFPFRFDLITSNPPYVDAADMRALPAEYRAEPALGLAAGEQGLNIIAPIIAQLPQWLSPEGVFIGEVGASAAALLQAFPRLPFIWPELPLGGEGVFLLEASALPFHTAPASMQTPTSIEPPNRE